MENNLFDFKVNINENRAFRILQITDFQPIDPTQKRYPDRLCEADSKPLTWEEKYKNLYFYIDKLVKENKPDLILVTGDIVYGEFDDNGSMFLEVINYVDKYQIPWAPVFGNHENESKKGVAWQSEQFLKMKNCLFKRRNLTGNGNYNIGIFRNNKLIRVLYMLDSNGCGHAKKYTYFENYPTYNENEHITEEAGIFEDQIQWVDESCKKIDNYFDVKKLITFHITPSIVRLTSYKKGYVSNDLWGNQECFDLTNNSISKDNDFGTKEERFCDCATRNLWDVLKQHKFTNLFIGHCHKNTLVIMCDKIRVSFGIKTGLYDYHNKSGGTLILIDKLNRVLIKHKIIDRVDL